MISKYQTALYGILFLLNIVTIIRTCKISEFPCKANGNCLPLDKFCDGIDDCGDFSDEPKFCTVCNRTYYGDVGRTYAIQVPTPQWNKVPFFCHLTFTASGHQQGDLVQIIFDGFTVGRFEDSTGENEFETADAVLFQAGTELPGCPDGFMQLSELGRPFTGGSWCGTASGVQQYFSETSTVTASVKVFHAPSIQQEVPFEFRIRYKFLSQSEAVVRYGTSSDSFDLGRVTPGTYCTRQFDECTRNKCRLQSPNYPGMYPRNVTCYWTIRQKTVPTCKHAMISVSQENSHKSLVKRSIASLNKTARTIRAWSDCTGERDHLIFYDGSSTNDIILAKFCGGDFLPKVVSRSNEMLIAFHSSPYSAPLVNSGSPNRGFELNVDILFTDSDSYDFVQAQMTRDMTIKCEFHINASSPDDVIMSQRNGRLGRLLSPRHTLPPNTTCTYYFHGFPNDLIWLSFTSHHLQVLQPVTHDNLTAFGQSDQPPVTQWITRMRLYDSVGTQNHNKLQSTPSTLGLSSHQHQLQQRRINNSNRIYYKEDKTDFKGYKFNMEQSWNPVNNYIYGPTVNSVYNQQKKDETQSQKKLERILNTNNINNNRERERDKTKFTEEHEKDFFGKTKNRLHSNRKLLGEFFNNEAPKLCDHAFADRAVTMKKRFCSPLESYVSMGRDMKMEFTTATGTALYPYTFSMNYEFVDTEIGGDLIAFDENDEDDKKLENEFTLCSRTFRGRRGEFRSPRNVFLHGRGGAKNLSCLYRFEAELGEQIRITLYNVSFGESGYCSTEADVHTGRPRCQTESGEASSANLKMTNDDSSKVRELNIYDVPYQHMRIQLGCICDNQSIFYNQPLTFQSSSPTLELTFIATKLNITEDFLDLFFYASYEIVKIPDCKYKHKLTASGGEENAYFNIRNIDNNCNGMAWLAEAKKLDHSLFIQAWGTDLPTNPSPEDLAKCQTKNRLVIYSGQKMKIICPIIKTESRQSSLRIFSDDWMNSSTLPTKPISLLIEPILREPGSVSFAWMEIQRTKASLVHLIENQTNFVGNETLLEFGLYPKDGECEFKCPEIEACISSSLWCDGYPNCPSGFDESSSECGAARKLMELPAGLFAALGFIAAGIAACLIFCMIGISKRRKKLPEPKHTSPAATHNGTYTQPKSNDDTLKKESLFYNPEGDS